MSFMLTNLLLAFSAGIGVFLIVVSFRYHEPKKDLDRISALRRTAEDIAAAEAPEDSFYRNVRKGGLEVALVQADLDVTPAGFIRVGIIIALIAFALGYVISAGPLTAMFMMVASLFLYYFWLGIRRDAKKLEYEEAIADTCDRLSSGAQLNPTLQGAIAHAVETCPEIIKEDLTYISNQLSQGAGIDAAFGEVLNRRQSYSLNLLFQTLKIWSVRGTTRPLSDTIKPLKESIRDMADTGRRMDSELTEARLTATIVTIAPPLFVLFFRTAIPSTDPIYSSLTGQLIQILSYSLAAVGFVITMRIIRGVRQVLEIE
jgi:Flp pilus assembly protein TadB